MENRLLQLPRPMLIGIRQSGLLRRFRNPQMPQFPFAGCQPLADLPQASRLSDMAEQHGHQLSPTRKPARVPLGLMLANGLLEFPRGNNPNSCAKMLHTRFMAEASGSLDLNLVLENQTPPYRTSASSQKLIGTLVVRDLRHKYRSMPYMPTWR